MREALAAEYALGTLQGLARARFERSMKDSPRLRHLVAGWQERLASLDEMIEPVQPPARVWRAIESRIQPRARRHSFWANIGVWRSATMVSAACAIALAVYLALLAPTATQPTPMMVAVMSGDQGKPEVTVSWPSEDRAQRKLHIRVIDHAQMAPGTSWELWMLPADGQKPVSLGLIGTAPVQEMVLPPRLAQTINAAGGLALSVEPTGGSPTGQPTGPIICKGPTTRL
ncbi:MAG: anti-sigma factor [Betaproteobacteria bacterium]